MSNNDLTHCPNIGGSQVLMRKVASVFGVIATLFSILIITHYNLYTYNFIIFIISFGTGVTIFETLDKTCIVKIRLCLDHLSIVLVDSLLDA